MCFFAFTGARSDLSVKRVKTVMAVRNINYMVDFA
jgi:hypothetical protein